MSEPRTNQAGSGARPPHPGASHITWIGKSGWKDWQLRAVILHGDWTLVTRNSFDFRGPASAPGTRGQYANVALHAGLVCLNGPVGMDLHLQLEMFAVALDELDRDSDLINQGLEVVLRNSEDEFEVLR
jgi:hypothetical protein